MTSPIQLADIKPPQLAPSDHGLDDLGQLLIHVTQGRQQLALERQRIAIEQRRVESEAKRSATLDEQTKLDIEEKKRALEQRDLTTQGADAASEAIVAAATAPGGLAKNAEAARIAAIQKNRKLAPYISTAFSAQLEGWQKSQEALAQRRTAETTANVGEATAGARITTAKAGAITATNEAKRSNVDLALDEIKRLNDPQRAAVFLDALAKHVPVGAAREVAGIPNPFKTLSDSYMLPDPTGTEAQRKAESSAAGMAFGNALIKSAYASDPHLRVSQLGAYMRTHGVVQTIASPFVSDGQKQLIQGFQMLGAHYALHITGTQSSNDETVRLMNTLADQPSDSDALLARRAFVRDVAVKQAYAAASGKATPVEAMQELVDAAKRFRLDPKTISVFQQMQSDAQRFMRSNDYKVQQQGAKAPADATQSFDDPVLNKTFSIQRPRP